jgi:hypothetical protein
MYRQHGSTTGDHSELISVSSRSLRVASRVATELAERGRAGDAPIRSGVAQLDRFVPLVVERG